MVIQKLHAALQHLARLLLGGALVSAGLGHLVWSRLEFQAQVPPWLPMAPDRVVVLSGVAEIVLGLALIVLWKRRAWAGWAAAVFFGVIFPGNIAQWLHHRNAFGLNTDAARAVRLLFQPPLVLWALWSTGAWARAPWKRKAGSSAQDAPAKP